MGALARLEAAAAQRYGVRPTCAVAGPGSQALIQALSHILPHGATGALGPTYSGFASAFAAAGARVIEAERLEELDGFDVAIVVNPDDPDGQITPRAALLDLHARLARRRGVLIVDEAFADFDAKKESVAPLLPTSRAVVLRSFGKAYGLAGLRLGFALASPNLVASVRAALGPWPVSGPAIAIGVRALADFRLAQGDARATRRRRSANSTPCCAAPVPGEFSAERTCIGWPRAPTRAPPSGSCLQQEFSPALSQTLQHLPAIWNSSRRVCMGTARRGAARVG